MVVVMSTGATEAQIQAVAAQLATYGMDAFVAAGTNQTVLTVANVPQGFDPLRVRAFDGVSDVCVSRKPENVPTTWPNEPFSHNGDGVPDERSLTVVAGPCAVESEEQLDVVAEVVARNGGTWLRGGAFKPRSSPYSFQGLGEEGLRLLAEAGKRHGLKVITEVMRPSHVDMVSEYADVLQIGTRNMQNFELLREVGLGERPVLLKRGFAATIEEWLLSAEYIISGGNERVILCERGIRTFESATRNTLDISAVPVVQSRSHLPVFVDPSHAAGRRDLVPALACAAVAVGAEGIMVEVHPDPARALSDGPQSLHLEQFEDLMRQVRAIAAATGRPIADLREISLP